MGTKPTRKRKYFLLYLACLGVLSFVIGGCLHFSKKLEGQKLLEEGMTEMINHRYEASLARNLTVLDEFPPSLADQALFQLGLLYAHPENPNQNYQKSLGSFKQILNEFSESPFRHRAKLWALFVGDAIDKKRKIATLNEESVSLTKTVKKQKVEIALLQKKIETRKNVDIIDALEKAVDEQKKEITALQDQIEKLKRVDLKIEEEKQKILRENEDIEGKGDGENSGR